jgi:hypothetical protein
MKRRAIARAISVSGTTTKKIERQPMSRRESRPRWAWRPAPAPRKAEQRQCFALLAFVEHTQDEELGSGCMMPAGPGHTHRQHHAEGGRDTAYQAARTKQRGADESCAGHIDSAAKG